MNVFDSSGQGPAVRSGVLWCAWMVAVAAGMILYGMVDDSPFVDAMHRDLFFGGCWLGIETGSMIAAVTIALAGAVLTWSMFRHGVETGRRDILWRLAFPFTAALVVGGWMVGILIATGGHWVPSPWAVTFHEAGWPSEMFRWSTGWISALLLVTALGGSAVAIAQALKRSEFPTLRVFRAGFRLEIEPLPLGASLAPWTAAGIFIMLISVFCWGLMASRDASDAFHARLGPFGLPSSWAWFSSVLLFGIASAFSARAAWRARTPGVPR